MKFSPLHTGGWSSCPRHYDALSIDVDGIDASLAEMVHKLKPEVTRDEKFARLAWARVLKGNAEGADEGESLPPNIDGFVGTRLKGPNGQDYVDPATLKYVEAAQLTYTLTRPDVYNAIMAMGIPEGVVPEGAVSGTANVGRGTYFGPGAPAGPRYHHYVFELYALSAMLDLPANATRAQLLDATKDIIVGKSAYVGRFRQ